MASLPDVLQSHPHMLAVLHQQLHPREVLLPQPRPRPRHAHALMGFYYIGFKEALMVFCLFCLFCLYEQAVLQRQDKIRCWVILSRDYLSRTLVRLEECAHVPWHRHGCNQLLYVANHQRGRIVL